MNERVYLDHNATSPIRPVVAEAMVRALALGNPSSVHAEGRQARAAVEEAREAVAMLVGARAKNVIFTSGGSEAAAMALTPHLHRSRDGKRPARLLVSAVEHPCVLAGGRFAPDAVTRIAVDADGRCDLEDLRARLAEAAADGELALVALQAANNETGVIQPVREAAEIVREAGGFLVCDAVQAIGRIKFSINEIGADVILISAHKIGGPKGVGALVLADAALDLGPPLVAGGGQELNRRAGTENVAGIVGFGVAAREARADLTRFIEDMRALRDRLESAVMQRAAQAVIFGKGAERLPNTSAFTVPGVRAETLLMRFDLDGIAISSGSACSSGKVRRSHVLEAMGVAGEIAEGALRVSFGFTNTQNDVDRFVGTFEKTIDALHLGHGGRSAA